MEEAADGISSKLGNQIENGRRSLIEMQKVVLDKTKYAAKTTDEFVQGNPWASIGIAAGVGFDIGYLLKRD
jgi:ElaB/YqjD/DUF883 family membrane-anchored ribosome-binding protein